MTGDVSRFTSEVRDTISGRHCRNHKDTRHRWWCIQNWSWYSKELGPGKYKFSSVSKKNSRVLNIVTVTPVTSKTKFRVQTVRIGVCGTEGSNSVLNKISWIHGPWHNRWCLRLPTLCSRGSCRSSSIRGTTSLAIFVFRLTKWYRWNGCYETICPTYPSVYKIRFLPDYLLYLSPLYSRILLHTDTSLHLTHYSLVSPPTRFPSNEFPPPLIHSNIIYFPLFPSSSFLSL